MSWPPCELPQTLFTVEQAISEHILKLFAWRLNSEPFFVWTLDEICFHCFTFHHVLLFCQIDLIFIDTIFCNFQVTSWIEISRFWESYRRRHKNINVTFNKSIIGHMCVIKMSNYGKKRLGLKWVFLWDIVFLWFFLAIVIV